MNIVTNPHLKIGTVILSPRITVDKTTKIATINRIPIVFPKNHN